VHGRSTRECVQRWRRCYAVCSAAGGGGRGEAKEGGLQGLQGQQGQQGLQGLDWLCLRGEKQREGLLKRIGEYRYICNL
jgi:hypothetical protein